MKQKWNGKFFKGNKAVYGYRKRGRKVIIAISEPLVKTVFFVKNIKTAKEIVRLLEL